MDCFFFFFFFFFFMVICIRDRCIWIVKASQLEVIPISTVAKEGCLQKTKMKF